MKALQYVSDEKGKPTAVIIPIELWREFFLSFPRSRRGNAYRVASAARNCFATNKLAF